MPSVWAYALARPRPVTSRAVVGVAAHVGEPDAGDAQVLELVVAADRGERDPVVDLADLVQRLRRVLGDEQHAVGVLQRDHGAAAGDALAGVVGPVLHQLLGRDVERHAHRGGVLARVRCGAAGPSGRVIRPAMTRSAIAATSSSGSRRPPSAVITCTTGKIRRVRSGPPVAESSSAASYSACDDGRRRHSLGGEVVAVELLERRRGRTASRSRPSGTRSPRSGRR